MNDKKLFKVKVIHWIVKQHSEDENNPMAKVEKIVEDKGTFKEVKARLVLSAMGITWRSGKKALFTVDQKREYEYRLKGEFRTTVMVYERIPPNNEQVRARIKNHVREVYRNKQSFITPELG